MNFINPPDNTSTNIKYSIHNNKIVYVIILTIIIVVLYTLTLIPRRVVLYSDNEYVKSEITSIAYEFVAQCSYNSIEIYNEWHFKSDSQLILWKASMMNLFMKRCISKTEPSCSKLLI